MVGCRRKISGLFQHRRKMMGRLKESIVPALWLEDETEHHNTKYSNVLLRELAAEWPRDSCGCQGCKGPVYQGKAANPYHCCSQHNNAIKISQSSRRETFLVHLEHYGLINEVRAFRSAGWIKVKRNPRKSVVLNCSRCGRKFKRKLRTTRKQNVDRFCSKCSGGRTRRLCSLITLHCAYCGESIQRLKGVLRYGVSTGSKRFFCNQNCQRKYQQRGQLMFSLTCANCGRKYFRKTIHAKYLAGVGFRRTFCSECWGLRASLACSHCGRKFLRKFSKIKYAQKIGRSRTFCVDCRRSHPNQPVFLRCSLCGHKFQRDFILRKHSGKITFCPTCWSSRRGKCMGIVKQGGV